MSTATASTHETYSNNTKKKERVEIITVSLTITLVARSIKQQSSIANG